MNLLPFHHAMSLAEDMYGVTMQEDRFEELADKAWVLIGNKRTRIYRYSTCVSNCEEGVQLPCNVDEIEAVTTDFEEWNYTTNDTPNGDLNSAVVESYIESRKAFRDPLYAPGKFIRYERVGDMLYFDRPHGKINILYRGEILDDDGFPQITDKEAMAIAAFCAYYEKQKEAFRTNNKDILQFANVLKQEWAIRCDQARVGTYLSQNEWDKVLDAKTSWNRKIHGKSLKVYR